jgi:hypothetical protein
MKYLLDVNALVALGNSAHADHTAAEQWLVQIQGKGDTLASCAISELGFVRVSVQAGLLPSVAVARNVLAKLKASVGVEVLADGLAMDRLPPYVKLPAQLTDGHLLELATSHGAQLATFDKGIPRSVLIR